MSFVQIPKSCTLRLVRTDNQDSNLANLDNRLLWQEDYIGYNDIPYAQKILSSDTILIQFATDYDLSLISAELYDINDNLISDKTADITNVLESTSFDIYNLSIQIAIEGYYYLKLTFDSEIYESEIFVIDGFDNDRLVKIEYSGSENDGVLYDNDETFVIRLEGRLLEYIAGQNKETYTSFNETMVNLNSYPKRMVNLEYGAIPRFMAEKLNIAFAHTTLKINDIEFQADDEPDSEIVSDGEYVTNMYKGKIRVQQVDYENYTTASDDVEPTTAAIVVDESDTLSYLHEGGTNYYNIP